MRITIIVVVLIWLIPTMGVLITSFRPADLANRSGWWTVFAHPFRAGEWTLENYGAVLTTNGFNNAFLNSLAVAIPSTIMPITIAAFAAYGFAWMRSRPRRAVRHRRRADGRAPPDGPHPHPAPVHPGADDRRHHDHPGPELNGTFLGIWLAHTGFGLPLATYLLWNYIRSLPSSIIESAKIDGADHFTIFWRLVVPLSVPALAAFAIFQFLWVWNDLLVAYVFLGGTQSTRVLTIALANLVGAHGEDWYLLTSAAFITMALPSSCSSGSSATSCAASPPAR